MERVLVLRDMIDKPKTIVGLGKRIAKNKLGKIKEGTLRGSYFGYTDNQKNIPKLRETLHKTIYEFVKIERDKAEKNYEATKKHSLNSNIDTREY